MAHYRVPGSRLTLEVERPLASSFGIVDVFGCQQPRNPVVDHGRQGLAATNPPSGGK